MIEYRTILLATDFSEPAAEAGRHALSLARACGARLHLLHVVQDFSYWNEFALQHFPSDDVYRELQRNARMALDDLLQDEPGIEEVPHEAHVREGKPFVEIIKVARELEADVIVIGSHGQSGLAETLFGSTAERVVRKAPCAVLVVRHPDHRFEMP